MSDAKDLLSDSAKGTTKLASAINAPPAVDPVTADTIQQIVDDFFKTHTDPTIRLAYEKGNIFSLKDDFDFFRFLKSIMHIFEERIINNELSSIENQQVKIIFETMDKCVDTLKTLSLSSTNSEILPILINYCLSSFSRYNKSYVKSKEIQK